MRSQAAANSGWKTGNAILGIAEVAGLLMNHRFRAAEIAHEVTHHAVDDAVWSAAQQVDIAPAAGRA